MFGLGVLPLFILQKEAPTGIGSEAVRPSEFNVKIILLNDALINAGQDARVDYFTN